MRPYKRATLIAKSIIKMIEDSGGGSVQISGAAVLLPAPIFDSLLQDSPTQADEAAERLRIRGIAFDRVASRHRRKRKGQPLATISGLGPPRRENR